MEWKWTFVYQRRDSCWRIFKVVREVAKRNYFYCARRTWSGEHGTLPMDRGILPERRITFGIAFWWMTLWHQPDKWYCCRFLVSPKSCVVRLWILFGLVWCGSHHLSLTPILFPLSSTWIMQLKRHYKSFWSYNSDILKFRNRICSTLHLYSTVRTTSTLERTGIIIIHIHLIGVN